MILISLVHMVTEQWRCGNVNYIQHGRGVTGSTGEKDVTQLSLVDFDHLSWHV